MKNATWPFPKSLLHDRLAVAVWSSGTLLFFVIAATIGYAWWTGTSIGQSFWAVVISNMAPWYALVIGVYLLAVTFPSYVLYGDTRRRFFQRIVLFTIPFSLGLGLLALAGYLLEGAVYRIAGWHHIAGGGQIANSTTDAFWIGLTVFVQTLPWFAFGTLFGALYIGSQRLLLIAIPLGILGVGMTNAILGRNQGFSATFSSRFDGQELHLSTEIIVPLVLTMIVLGLLRIVTKDISIQSQRA